LILATKAVLMFCLFGAPVSFENNTERALEFIAAIQEELKHLETLTGARYRIGISSGSGIYRRDRQCRTLPVCRRGRPRQPRRPPHGKPSGAKWWPMKTCSTTAISNLFYRGEEEYKGFEQKAIPTYLLSGRNLGGRSSFSAANILAGKWNCRPCKILPRRCARAGLRA
jgi:hypothetical protein